MNKPSLPSEVVQAMTQDWGVLVDAYLFNAACVGNRFAATVFCDRSGAASDGMTVATQPVRLVSTIGGFKLLRTLDGADHYVIATETKPREAADGDRG
ncbi:hypothetical protein E0H95_20400 [Pseudomonas syringae pv. tomato]|nr:hypothetical protein [Pseudomonas sp. CFBP 8772]MBW8023305.1 hypothetical protein [Pseudomonas syringae pv. tomato]